MMTLALIVGAVQFLLAKQGGLIGEMQQLLKLDIADYLVFTQQLYLFSQFT